MEIGIGLPATIPGVNRESLLGWARGAEQKGFSSLGTIDRLVYPNYEPLTALTAAAAVTEKIRLTTAILLAPLRNTALLAKQAATLEDISGGRLVLGVAVGAREDDYTAGGADYHRRGRKLEEQLEEMKRIWEGEERGFAGAIGPRPSAGGPEIIVGGQVDAAFERAARYGSGWIAGGGGPAAFAGPAEKARRAWENAGRDGSPRLLALSYFSLGARAEENADSYIHDYYGFAGPYADRIAEGVATSAERVREQIDAFSSTGCDELIFFPCSTDLEQVDLLAEAAF